MYFQIDVLINYFLQLRRAETITWENFIQEKQEPGSTKGISSCRDETFCM